MKKDMCLLKQDWINLKLQLWNISAHYLKKYFKICTYLICYNFHLLNFESYQKLCKHQISIKLLKDYQEVFDEIHHFISWWESFLEFYQKLSKHRIAKEYLDKLECNRLTSVCLMNILNLYAWNTYMNPQN